MTNPQPASFDRPEPLSLSEQAYLVIRARILKGEIPLGGSLSRRKLAAELGISLLPMAEALQRLENDGLVESRPRVGTRVFFPTAREIQEQYEIREALESQSARLYAERSTARERMEMEDRGLRLDAMFNQCFVSQIQDRDFLYAVQSYHLEFHSRIAECGRCGALQQTIEKNQVLTLNWVFDVTASRPPLPPRFHRDLVQILNQGDPEAADAAMRRHIQYGQEAILRVASGEAKTPIPAGGVEADFEEARSLSERAYRTIRDRILRNELELGSALSRRKLAVELGMSLLPVAEALQQLERDGLAESRPRVGTRVYKPTASDIRERFEVREGLESQAARLFTQKASASQRQEMQKMADKMDAMYQARDAGNVSPDFLFDVQNYHSQLHLKIAEYTGAQALHQVLEKNHLLVFTWLSDVAAKRPVLPDGHHRILIDVLCNGTPEEADAAMRVHLRQGRDAILRSFPVANK